MKKILFYFGLFTALILIASSCGGIIQKPISHLSPENNQTYKVEYLFEHDGCKVYRFREETVGFYYVYFTNCNGESTAVNSDSTRVRTYNNFTKSIQP